jgi:hypothetical protein
VSALADQLAANRAAIARFIDVALAVSPDDWTRPRAPGKWSPAQVADHVATTMDQAVRFMEGRDEAVTIPRVLRPLVRTIALRPVLRSGRFPRPSRTPRAFEPAAGGAPQHEARARLESALAAFEATVRRDARTADATFEHGVFGRLSYADYVRFNAIHAAHHERQLVPDRA